MANPNSNNGTGSKSTPSPAPASAPAAEQTKARDPQAEGQTPGGTPPPANGAKGAPAFLRVTSKDGKPFRRAGHRFAKDPVVLDVKEDLDTGDLDRLLNEPALKVEPFATDPRTPKS